MAAKSWKEAGRTEKRKSRPEQKGRRFYQLEKNKTASDLMVKCHAAYRARHGHDASDAEVLRDCMRQYAEAELANPPPE